MIKPAPAVGAPAMNQVGVNVVTPWCNRRMLETPEEIDRLQQLLDRSAAGAGPHLKDIITDERRVSAEQLCQRLQGMKLLVVATVTADGRPLAGPVDGYFLHGLPQERTAPAGRLTPVSRSASSHSRVAVAVSRARRGG